MYHIFDFTQNFYFKIQIYKICLFDSDFSSIRPKLQHSTLFYGVTSQMIDIYNTFCNIMTIWKELLIPTYLNLNLGIRKMQYPHWLKHSTVFYTYM